MEEGWIKLYRSLREWQHYGKPSCVVLFIELLLTANTEDKWWHGFQVLRGEIITSDRNLSESTGLAVNTIRKSINELVNSGEIKTEVRQGRFTKFTIVNFEKYQGDSKSVSKRVSKSVSKNDTPTDTPTDNDLRIKNKEERNNNIVVAVDTRTHEEQLNEILSEQGWIETVCMNNHISLQQFNELIPEFNLEMAAQGKTNHNSVQDLKYHINSFIRKRLEIKQKQQRNGNKSNIQGERGIIDQEQWTQSTLQAIEEARRRHNSQSV